MTLEPGEVVSLRTLIRGMMYPSGNDAAWAIAFHVAQAYGVDQNGDNIVDGLDFVEMMNQHALAIGLTDTHFTSPNGWDDADHYTTARELARIIDHGLDADPYFGQVIGFSGTYTDTSQGPNGTKTYSWGWGFNYPGWEGMKGGGTTNCNGPNQGCQAISARRIARRVAVTFMQGTFGDEPGMFDYGFGQIFHPDPRGSSAPVGAAGRFDLDCSSSSRCVSAAVPSSGGPVELVSWGPDLDSSSIAVLDQEPVPGSGSPPPGGQGPGPERDTALTHLASGPIVVASRKGSSVELSRWSMDGGGALSLVADKIKAGPATTMDLQAVYGDMFLTAVTDPEGGPRRQVVAARRLGPRQPRHVPRRVARLQRGHDGRTADDRRVHRAPSGDRGDRTRCARPRRLGCGPLHRSDYPARRARPGWHARHGGDQPVLREHDLRRRAVSARVLRDRVPGERQPGDPLLPNRQQRRPCGRGCEEHVVPDRRSRRRPAADRGCHVCAARR